MFLAGLFELSYMTASESEQEEDVAGFVSQHLRSISFPSFPNVIRVVVVVVCQLM